MKLMLFKVIIAIIYTNFRWLSQTITTVLVVWNSKTTRRRESINSPMPETPESFRLLQSAWWDASQGV